MDIDVAALHAACLRAATKAGAKIANSRKLLSARREGAGWRIDTNAGPVLAQVLVNAAGAWADEVARACGVATIGIQPLGQKVVQLRTDQEPPRDLPLKIGR